MATKKTEGSGVYHQSDGWVKLHRKIRENWIWKDPIKFKWWVDILLEVNHKGMKVPIGMQLVECERGQSVRSLKGWADRWGVSRDTVREFLNLLESDRMITRKTSAKTTQITVCNYAVYQDTPHDEQTISKRLANDEQTITDTNKNDKKEKNDKNNLNIIGEVSPYFKKCVDIYFGFYKTKYGLSPAFGKAEGKHLKELLSKIEDSIRSGGKEVTETLVVDTFVIILNRLPKFYSNKADVKIINSNYNGIIAEIKSKGNTGNAEEWKDIVAKRNQ